MRKRRFFVWFLAMSYGLLVAAPGVWAQPTLTPTPPFAGPGGPGAGTDWRVDAEVTEVGKNSERARQLLFWIMSHPANHAVPSIASMWGTVLQIVLILFVIVFVIAGFSYILSRGRITGPIFSGISFPPVRSLLPKVVVLLAWALFSYVFVLGLVQIADLLMGWFIGKVLGSNLFNINFAGQNTEESYKTFVGYRDFTMVNQESANASLTLVRLTTFTYNFLTVMLILRAVILWFLIIVAPILSLLFPFVFIRNTGWIWIGEFFRWLFYGPLVAIFLLALVRVWETGIPYGFDWVTNPPGRRDTAEGIVYPTAINILVGGPAQTLTPTNSVNYVDTYAEYVIALVMLWTVILLPFLLLRIFRDYCCDVFAAQQGTLWALYDKIKDIGKPPTPPAGPRPTEAPEAVARELPFREARMEAARITERQLREIVRAETSEMVASLNLEMQNIRDIAQVDINRQRQMVLRQNLERLARPEVAKSKREQESFVRLRQEFESRAEKGDMEARRIIQAASVAVGGPVSRPKMPGVRIAKPGLAVIEQATVTPQVWSKLVEEGKPKVAGVVVSRPGVAIVEREKVDPEFWRELVEERLVGVAQVVIPKTRVAVVPREKVRPGVRPVPTVAKPVAVSVEDYEEVKKMWVNHYRLSEIPVSDKIKTRLQWIENDITLVKNALDFLGAVDPRAKEQGMKEVALILPFILLGGFSEEEVLTYLRAKKSAAEQVREEVVKEEETKREEEKKEKVEVAAEKPEEEEKEAELAAKKEMPAPSETEETAEAATESG